MMRIHPEPNILLHSELTSAERREQIKRAKANGARAYADGCRKSINYYMTVVNDLNLAGNWLFGWLDAQVKDKFGQHDGDTTCQEQ